MTMQQIEKINPDEKGIIKVNDNGTERRFVKAKLVSYLQTNEALRAFKIKKAKTTREGVIAGSGGHRKRPIIATLPDGTEKPFNSLKNAADEFGFSKYDYNNIPKALVGKYKSVQGIKFRSAPVNESLQTAS